MSLRELLEQQPAGTVAADEDDLGFIGMPKGYVPTKPGVGGPVSIRQAERGVQYGTQITPPKYKVGAEMEPRSYSPEMIARLQQQLAAAGLIGPSTRYRLGVWDSTSTNAYKQLLTHANRGGLSREDALTELLMAPQVKGDGTGVMGEGGAMSVPQGRMNTYEASDPASVRQTAEQAFKQALGRKPNKKELESFTAAFLGRERGSQEVVFAAQGRLQARNEAAAGAAAGASAGAAAGGGSEADILWNRLQQMVADSPYEIGLGKRSRSLEEQEYHWKRYQSGQGPLAAKPGTSKHGNGRANDLKYSSPKARQWVIENAHKYGLALPLYNPNLPRSKDESWHVELADGHSVGDGHDHGGGGAPVVPAAMNENVTVQRQDMGAQALEFARDSNPTETAAYEIGGQFQNMMSILSRGVV